MRLSLLCALVSASCATHPSHNEMADVFEMSYKYMVEAEAAAPFCQVFDRDYNPPPPGNESQRCAPADLSFDREACVVFDAAIQKAAAPLSLCGRSEMIARHTGLDKLCASYMNTFMTRCVGEHALQLAFKELAISQAYRAARADGMPVLDAETLYLDRIVRLRD